MAHVNMEHLLSHPELLSSKLTITPEGYVEIIKDRVYWASVSTLPRGSNKLHMFSIDQELVYEPFFADFGPLNLGCTYRYCRMMKSMLDDKSLADKKILHYCSSDPKKRANAAYLMSCFLVMYLRRSAEDAVKPFENIKPAFQPFRDATCGICTFQCTIYDCVKGLAYAMGLGWFNATTFDLAGYEYYEQIQNGDMNWIVPDKFLAFVGPSATSMDYEGYPCLTPEDYIRPFKSGNIQLVVRLNKKQYDRRRFTDHGIKHVDLYFLDGSCPPKHIIDQFLQIVEQEPGAVAVHCKAGLGRTGTLIGLWAQKHFQFPGRAWVGWNRICRPGAMLGPQQQFMVDMEQQMFQAGQLHRAKLGNQPRLSLRDLNENEAKEDVGQGDRLVEAKQRHSPSGLGGFFGRGSNYNNQSAPPLRNIFGQKAAQAANPNFVVAN